MKKAGSEVADDSIIEAKNERSGAPARKKKRSSLGGVKDSGAEGPQKKADVAEKNSSKRKTNERFDDARSRGAVKDDRKKADKEDALSLRSDDEPNDIALDETFAAMDLPEFGSYKDYGGALDAAPFKRAYMSDEFDADEPELEDDFDEEFDEDFIELDEMEFDVTYDEDDAEEDVEESELGIDEFDDDVKIDETDDFDDLNSEENFFESDDE